METAVCSVVVLILFLLRIGDYDDHGGVYLELDPVLKVRCKQCLGGG